MLYVPVWFAWCFEVDLFVIFLFDGLFDWLRRLIVLLYVVFYL